jgi:hypothetical protein
MTLSGALAIQHRMEERWMHNELQTIWKEEVSWPIRMYSTRIWKEKLRNATRRFSIANGLVEIRNVYVLNRHQKRYAWAKSLRNLVRASYFVPPGSGLKYLYLYTKEYKHIIKQHRHPCLEWDSNPQPQCLSGRRLLCCTYTYVISMYTYITKVFWLVMTLEQNSINFLCQRRLLWELNKRYHIKCSSYVHKAYLQRADVTTVRKIAPAKDVLREKYALCE